jgi:hypothetical protein
MAQAIPDMNKQNKPPRSVLVPPLVDQKKFVADALNEHGFLLQQAVVDKLRGKTGNDRQRQWNFVASEYPVTAADGSQTKIDILVKHAGRDETYLCIECKRPNPRFKKWVFFGNDSGVEQVSDWIGNIETVHISHRRTHEPEGIRYSLKRITKKIDVPFFCYYVEAVAKRDNQSDGRNTATRQSASSTDAIEKSFQQLLRGHSGLVEKFCQSNATGLFQSIPVVVTTADILEAAFDSRRISEGDGMINEADLKLVPREYCAVNYRADDTLAVKNRTGHERSIGTIDLVNGQIRTVFVVNIRALNKFLNWAGQNLINIT